jgi:hypothetical protein
MRENTMSIDPSSNAGTVHDGLSGTSQPLPRDTGQDEELDAAPDAPEAGSDKAGGGQDSAEGGNVDTDAGQANSAGGVLYAEGDKPSAHREGGEGTVEGYNKAAGPAEELDEASDDERDLTTDISPSD